jgi:GT2 family glycosyltransferase
MLTLAIVTYERGAVLCETIEHVLRLEPAPSEILIVDQTPHYPPDIDARLRAWEAAGDIRVIRLPRPSIPHAMNAALRESANDIVLFIDDDVIPDTHLAGAHLNALREPGIHAVAGQVLQPGEQPRHVPESDLRRGAVPDLDFRFFHDTPCDVRNVMAGNLSVDRARALAAGGFDENFSAVAYRFETDFAMRIIRSGGRIRFEPAATLRHLKAPGGGVRSWGDHRSSASPAHSMGDYYFARTHVPRFWSYVASRLRSNIITRYHARHPWMIPPKVIGELRGLAAGTRLARAARRSRE